jgi:hypothetical protein
MARPGGRIGVWRANECIFMAKTWVAAKRDGIPGPEVRRCIFVGVVSLRRAGGSGRNCAALRWHLNSHPPSSGFFTSTSVTN